MFKRIQTLRLLLKQTKVLKGKSSRFIYTRRLRTINSQFTKSIINCNLCTGKELLTISTENQQRSLRGKDVKTINDLFAFIMQGKEFYMKLLVNIFNTIKFEELNEKQAILLLNCCGKDVYDSSKESRDNICQKLYTHFLKNNLITPNICRTYINVCTENNVAVDLENFLNQLTFEPDQEVIKDLMKNVCNKGNIQSALKLLEIMKNIGFPIDEDVFNSLVYAHVLVGGIENANPVLQTMKIAQIPESKATNYALFKGTVTLGNENDFLKFLQTTQFKLSENYLLEILECVGLNGNHSWMPKILSLIKEKPQSLEFKTKLKQLCVHLVHMNQAESSMSIYRTFSEPTKEEKYGFFLLKEMLHCDLPINVIIKLAKQLKEENLNETIIGDLTEIALRHKYVESAWQLLENMDELRPHFFWPLLINARNTEGETEVINIVKRMMEKNIKPDFETLESYIIPFCKIDNSKLFIYTFEKLGFTVKEVLSPLVCVLLNLNRVTEAENICRSYNVRLFGETFLNSLSFAWNNSKNCESIVFLLQRYCESEILFSRNDIVGEFLIKSIHLCRTINDITDFIKLLKTFHKKKLTISCVSLNVLKDILMINVSSEHLRKQLEENLESIVDYTLQMESSSIPHPNEMTLNELECHLVELEEKNMETRGVLRKLIQIHCNANNSQRVNELYEKFLERGYEESPGILSSLMQLYIKNDETEAALNIYNKLKTKYSNFNLDGFKIFHLAAALVKNSKFDEAFSIVESEFQSKKFVEPRTCVYLLNSFDNEEQQLKMFNYLIENRICKPVNIVLGPLVRLHLKNKQLEKAVETYINLAEKYKCTPLQLEIFCAILEVKNQDLLKKVTDVTEKVHGSLGASIAMICALAEMGMDKSLIKFLTTLEIRVLNEINKRCQRWIKEGKTLPLETLAKVSVKFPTILDLKTICDSLMQIYELNGDCQSAINLYESLIDSNEELVNKSLKQKLISLLNKHKYDIPKIVNISV